MPGGRGGVIEVAQGLSVDDEDVKTVSKAYRMLLDSGEYRIDYTLAELSAAIVVCTQRKAFRRLWCHAVFTGRVDVREY